VRSIREQNAAQRGVAGIGWDIARQQITCDIRVGQFEKLRESRTFVACGLAVALAQVTEQQEIEFLHATTAAPFELAEVVFQLVLALDHHLLDLRDRLRGVQILRARLGAIHDRVAAVQPERVFEFIEPFAGCLVARIDDPAIGRE